MDPHGWNHLVGIESVRVRGSYLSLLLIITLIFSSAVMSLIVDVWYAHSLMVLLRCRVLHRWFATWRLPRDEVSAIYPDGPDADLGIYLYFSIQILLLELSDSSLLLSRRIILTTQLRTCLYLAWRGSAGSASSLFPASIHKQGLFDNSTRTTS